MPSLYRYKAVDSKGNIHKGEIPGRTQSDINQQLQSMGMELIRCSIISPGTGFRLKLFRPYKLKSSELISLSFELYQLLKAGVPVLDALDDLKNSHDSIHIKNILSGLVKHIQGGKTLSAALAEYPDSFDSVYVNMVQVGEQSGRLPLILLDLYKNLKWHNERLAQARKIMVYPLLVSIVILSVLSYLMTVLVPQLIPFIMDISGQIPLQTQILIATSSFLGQYGYIILLVLIISISSLLFLARRNDSLARYIDHLKLRLYLFGPLIVKIRLARFASAFSIMYASGIPVIQALKISESIMDNRILEQSIRDIRHRIADGQQISDSFQNAYDYPPLVIRMLKVGEASGNLDQTLNNISDFYNRQVRESIELMETMITPLLTIIPGAILFWIMSAILGPVYNSLGDIPF